VLQILWLNLTTDGAPAIALAVEATEPNTMFEGPRLRSEPLLEKVMVTGMVIQSIALTTCVLLVYVIGLNLEFGVVPLTGQPTDLSVYRRTLGDAACGVGLFNSTWGDNDVNACNFTYLCHNITGRVYEFGVNDLDGPCYSIFPDFITNGDFDHGYQAASTMVTFTIIFAELARAYSSRSMRESVFKIGFFSNSWMQYGVFSAVIATWLLYVIPGVNDVFAMVHLSGTEFGVVFGFCFIPFILDEFCKVIYRMTGFGKRPIVQKLDMVKVDTSSRAFQKTEEKM